MGLSQAAGQVLSGGISGISSLVGSLISSSSARALQRETNAQNYKIWQESMAHDVDMFNMENQANIDMWNMQNEYNDPSAQMERLAAAGLNPYLAMSSSSNSTGVATSAPTSASVNKSQSPTMQMPSDVAFDYGIKEFSNSVLSGVLGAAQVSNINADTGNKASGTDLNNSNVNINKILESLYKRQDNLEDETFGFKLQQEQYLTANLMATNSLLGLDKEAKEMVNSFLGPNLALEYCSGVIGILRQSVDLEKAKIELEHFRDYYLSVIANTRANTRLANAQAYNQEMDNKVKELFNSGYLKGLGKCLDIIDQFAVLTYLASNAELEDNMYSHKISGYKNRSTWQILDPNNQSAGSQTVRALEFLGRGLGYAGDVGSNFMGFSKLFK